MARVLGTSMAYLTGETDDRRPLNAHVPASEETGTGDVVAGAGFEPTTSGLQVWPGNTQKSGSVIEAVVTDVDEFLRRKTLSA